jgi:hypothetical protein
MHLREIIIDFLRRLLWGGPPETSAEIQSGAAGAATSDSENVAPGGTPETPTAARRDLPASCPYCAVLLDPPPERPRLCPRCRRRIVVRRVDGRRVLLTEEALDVFEAQRDRETREHTWTRECARWLALAEGVSAPANRIARLGAAPPSDAVVVASRDLYLAAAEHAVRTARRDKRWDQVARIRREQAAALYQASGSAVPPPDDVVALHREWSVASLRSLVKFGKNAELVSEGCCAVCRRDDGRAFRIAAELRAPRLPHAGCPKGLCPCDWCPVPDTKARRPRVRRRASPRSSPVPAPTPDTADDPSPAGDSEPAPVPEPEPGHEPEQEP